METRRFSVKKWPIVKLDSLLIFVYLFFSELLKWYKTHRFDQNSSRAFRRRKQHCLKLQHHLNHQALQLRFFSLDEYKHSCYKAKLFNRARSHRVVGDPCCCLLKERQSRKEEESNTTPCCSLSQGTGSSRLEVCELQSKFATRDLLRHKAISSNSGL